jgi:hypothetical protein
MTTDKVLKTNIITPVGQFQWVFVDNPKQNTMDPTKPPMYSITFVMDKKDPKVIEKMAVIKEAIDGALVKKFGDKKPAKYYNPIKDGDVETDGAGVPRYPGSWYFEAKNSTKPGLVNADREPIVISDAVWSGCTGRLSVGFVGYDAAGKKGVTIYLNNVQLIDNSAPKMSGKKSAEMDFAEE